MNLFLSYPDLVRIFRQKKTLRQMNTTDQTAQPHSEEIVRLIMNGDSLGQQMLCDTYMRGVKFLAKRWCSYDDVDDVVNQTLLTVIVQIQNGDLREPAALSGYVRSVLYNLSCKMMKDTVRKRNSDNSTFTLERIHAPRERSSDEILLKKEKQKIMMESFQNLNERDQELLRRFYLEEQSETQIRQEMSLSENQFRLYKSRAKQKLTMVAKRRFSTERSKKLQEA